MFLARLQWPLVLGLASLGLLVGALSLFGLWPVWAEFIIWIAAGASWVVLLHLRTRRDFFWHGAMTALIGGMLAVLCQIAFMRTYLENNASVGAQFEGVPLWQARMMFLATGLMFCVALAAVTGLALWLTFPKARRASRAHKD